jgi:uncharacterized protein YndB with AHSA1/START domain
MTTTNEQEPIAEREFIATRVINAPIALVYKAWTDPENIDKWWGPIGFSTTTSEMNVKVGGAWRYVMHGPDGTDYSSKVTYKVVIANERLVYDHAGEGDFSHIHFEVTVTFVPDGNKTKLTMRMLWATVEEFKLIMNEFAKAANGQTLDRMEAHLASMADNDAVEQKFTISRTFNAPRKLVFKAFTEADRMAQWWGPKGFVMEVNNLDLRPGGKYHYCMVSPEGYKMWGLFVYREIVAPERIVFVNSFSDEQGHLTRHPMAPNWPLEVLNTTTFTEHDGKTTMIISGSPINATQEEITLFHAMYQSMQQGFSGTFDQLDQYLATAQ